MSVKYSFRNTTPAELAACLKDARNYTLSLFERFESASLDNITHVPYLAIINPPLWELGHLVWFTEWFILRDAPSDSDAMATRPSILQGSDLWFDSSKVAHATRWHLDLPETKIIKQYANDVLNLVLDKLAKLPHENNALYLYRLALAHEDMHGEAYAYTLQTLGVSAAANITSPTLRLAAANDLQLDGGVFVMGSPDTQGFIFDNEKWAHEVSLPAFNIDSSLVSNAQYINFIQADGYNNKAYWDEAGRAWLTNKQRIAPLYWQQIAGVWQCNRNGKFITLNENEPVRHISLHEAQAYCRWANRRLPSEEEWEYAATMANGKFHWGELWEWTSSPFEPYAGFSPDTYKEYSAPWFYTHQSLRGASFVTQDRIRSPHYRNFYMADRDDIFVGFRTCAA
jgi:ergothioneine biosynthesis protein EgtB